MENVSGLNDRYSEKKSKAYRDRILSCLRAKELYFYQANHWYELIPTSPYYVATMSRQIREAAWLS